MDPSPSSALQIHAYSSFHHEEFCYRWNLNNAKCGLVHFSEGIRSPDFTVPRIPNKLFLLAHIIKNSSRVGKSYTLELSIKMSSGCMDNSNVFATKSSFSVLDSFAADTEKTTEGDGCTHFLHNDIITVQFSASLIWVTDPIESIIQNSVVSEHNPNKRMKLMFEDDFFKDITIKTGDKTFKAHKALLASYSDVFKKMFEIDMKEKRQGVVMISDIAPKVMADLLAYMYTGTAPHLKKLAKELLIAADKYNIPCLLVMCENELKFNLTSANVADILLFADGLHLETRLTKSLKEACIKFFQHHSSSVYLSSSWEKLKETSPKLAMETVESITRQD